MTPARYAKSTRQVQDVVAGDIRMAVDRGHGHGAGRTVRVGDRGRRADVPAVALGGILRHGQRRRRHRRDRAAGDTEVDHLAHPRRIGGGDVVRLAADQRLTAAERGGDGHTVHSGQSLPHGRVELAGLSADGASVPGVSTTTSAVRARSMPCDADFFSDAATTVNIATTATDQQRRGGRRGPSRIAQRVLAGQQARDTAQAGDGGTEDGRHGTRRDRPTPPCRPAPTAHRCRPPPSGLTEAGDDQSGHPPAVSTAPATPRRTDTVRRSAA